MCTPSRHVVCSVSAHLPVHVGGKGHSCAQACGPSSFACFLAVTLALCCSCAQLGPDLRAQVPLVMNMAVTGGLEVSGPAHPDKVGALRY